MEEIAAIIETEVNRFNGDETLATSLRCAALFVHEQFPDVVAKDFGDAAVLLGLHRQAAMNRWNEAKKNMGDEW